MTMPAQKPAASRQDYMTPEDFISAVTARFGHITHDLAAESRNTQCERFFGPGSQLGEDSLAQKWSKLTGTLWLNPPFRDIAVWAAKASRELMLVRAEVSRRHRHDWRVCLLTPASIGTDWFAEHVHGLARVIGLAPRLTFAGEKDPYPKDLMLSVYGIGGGFELWRWK